MTKLMQISRCLLTGRYLPDIMTNAWSLLYDELMITSANSDDYNDFWEQSYKLAKQSYNYNNATTPVNEDKITLNIPDLPEPPKNENGFWKYHEDVILKEIRDYLSGTYNAHYASVGSKTQTLDLIEGIGDAEPFCRSNAIKYLSRFGKKDGKSKRDILKAIHYCILLYHFAGLCNENSTPYETF